MITKTFGDVVLRDSMGDDLSVINAARVSFDKYDEEITDRGAGLIRYLARNDHWTPFGHVQITLYVHMPIFVARQLMRTTVGLVVNEVSRRYVDDEPEFFDVPVWRSRPDASIKQGSGVPIDAQKWADDAYDAHCLDCLVAYQKLLKGNVAPEQARIVLPLSLMTKVIWTGSLVAWTRLCFLRLDSHAQGETQWFAEKIQEQCRRIAPLSWDAIMGHRS